MQVAVQRVRNRLKSTTRLSVCQQLLTLVIAGLTGSCGCWPASPERSVPRIVSPSKDPHSKFQVWFLLKELSLSHHRQVENS